MPTFWRDIADVVFAHAGKPRLSLVERRLEWLEEAMTSAQNDVAALEQLYTALDEATNDIASKLNSLIEHANTGNVSASDVVAHLTPLVQRLQEMGKDNTVEGPTNPTTNTDPTNSPTADSPVVNPAPDAPTDNPTPDPTVNPVDIQPENLPQDGSNVSESSNVSTSGDANTTNTDNTNQNTSSTDW